MLTEPRFPLITTLDAERFQFYRIPKALMTEPEFDNVSTDAKLVYGVLFDRVSLSLKNGWIDKFGHVFIIYTIRSLAEDLHFGEKKVGRLLAELDDNKGVGLITRVRRGQGLPDKIYVHWFADHEMSLRLAQRSQYGHSGAVVETAPEKPISPSNYTESSHTDSTHTDFTSGSCCAGEEVTNIWNTLSSEDFSEIDAAYEDADKLISTVDDYVRRHHIHVRGPVRNYIHGTAEKMKWPRKDLKDPLLWL